jgi:hypothetical protein
LLIVNEQASKTMSYYFKSTSLFFLLFSFLTCRCVAQTWEHAYGYPGTPDAGDYGYAVIQTSDGGFACAGYTSSWGAGGKDVFVVKTDAAGHMQWQNVIGGLSDDVAYGIVQNAAGDYYVAGATNSYGLGSSDVYLIKFNSTGDTLWTKTYGGAQADNARAIMLTANEEIVMAGGTASFGAGSNDAYLIKTDTLGNLLWFKTIGRSGNDYALALNNIHDSGFIIGGYTESYAALNGYAIRTDSIGDTLWTKAFDIGTYSTRLITGVTELNNNNEFIFSGGGLRYSSGDFPHLFCISTALDGTFNYRRTTGTISDGANNITKTHDGGFATVGVRNNFGTRAELIKFDSLGIIQWRKTYQYISTSAYPYFCNGNSIAETSDSGFVLAGETYYSGQSDMLVIKTDALGNGQQYASMNITASGSTNFCTGGSVLLTAPPGFTVYKWLRYTSSLNWIAGADSSSYLVTQAGTYYCELADNNGIYHTTGITVTVIPIPTASVTPTYANFCAATGGSTTLTTNAVSMATYQWYLNGNPITGATNTSYSTSSSGTYKVVTTNSCGSATSNNVIVNASYIPYPSIYYTTNIIHRYYGSPSPCNYYVHFYINPISGASYQWYFNGNPLAGETNTSIDIFGTGTYYISVTTPCGTINSNSENVQIYTHSPTITAAGPISGCNLTSVNLYFSYFEVSSLQWNLNGNPIPGATGSSYTATASGTYTITFNPIYCTSTYYTSPGINVSLNSTPFPSIAASGNTTVCNSDSVLLSASVSGGSYQWKKNNVNISGATSQNYYASQSGNYTCVITTSSCGTNTSNSIAVWSGFPTGSTSASLNPICQGGSSNLSVASTSINLSYQWRLNGLNIPGAVNSTYTATSPGNYDCIITNTCGNIISNTVALTVNPSPIANLTPSGSVFLCPSQNILLIADTATGYAYQWKRNNVNISGATSPTYSANVTGSYTVNVTLSGCSSLSTPTVLNSATSPVANIWSSGPLNYCGGDSVRLNTNTSPNYSYQWFKNSVLIPGAVNSFYYAGTSANFSVMTSNQYGCTIASLPVTVNQNINSSLMILYYQLSTTFCINDSIELTSSITGTSYQWMKNNVIIPGATNQTYYADSAAIYSVSVTDFSGCTGVASISINNYPQPSSLIAPAGPIQLCTGDTVVLSVPSCTQCTYQWYRDTVMITGATTNSYVATQTGSYTILVANQYGCSSLSVPDTVILNNVSIPVASITSADTVLCPNDSIALNITQDTIYNYQWRLNGLNIPGATDSLYYAAIIGTYDCIVANVCGSITTNPILITPDPLNMIAISAADTVLCSGDSLELIATTDVSFSYQWRLNGLNILGAMDTSYFATAMGVYDCIISNSCGSSFTNTIIITQGPAVPGIPGYISGPNRPCPNTSSVNYWISPVNGATSYIWTVPLTASISSGQGSTSIYVDYSSSFISGIIRVRASNICGIGPTRNLLVSQALWCISSNPNKPSPEFDFSPGNLQLLLYPNPFSSSFTVNVFSPAEGSCLLSVIDIAGREILRTEIPMNSNLYFGENFSSGIYFIEVQTKSGVIAKRLVKQ